MMKTKTTTVKSGKTMKVRNNAAMSSSGKWQGKGSWDRVTNTKAFDENYDAINWGDDSRDE
jgi:hypothetical protein